MKTNHQTNKFKDLNREKNNRKFLPKRTIVIQNKRAILKMKAKQYQTCKMMLLKELNDATGVDTSNLVAKRDFIT